MWMSIRNNRTDQKIINISHRIKGRTTNRVKNVCIRMRTDANVTMVVDIPLKDICLVSDVAAAKLNSIENESYIDMDEILMIRDGYISLYKKMGINVTNSSIVMVDDEDDT